MADNYDVESQGRAEPCPTVTTCLMEKPEIDKKVKVSVNEKFLCFALYNTVVTAPILCQRRLLLCFVRI
jgi:hypothetical protein